MLKPDQNRQAAVQGKTEFTSHGLQQALLLLLGKLFGRGYVVQGKVNHVPVEAGHERLFFLAGEGAEVSSTPGRFAGGEQGATGKGPDRVDGAGAVSSKKRTAAAFCPVGAEPCRQGRCALRQGGQVLHMLLQAWQVVGAKG